MTKFQTLFGIGASDIKKTCILMPIMLKSALNYFKIPHLKTGKLYSSNSGKTLTLIQTGISASLLGDAVLYLADTPCENIILFGSCGLVKQEIDLDIGSIAVPVKCYQLESFTKMLISPAFSDSIQTETPLAKKFPEIKKVSCATLGSLKLEETLINLFTEKNIQIVDMECSAFFSAAQKINKNASALLYITDIINKKPFYMPMAPEDRKKITESIKSAAGILCKFIKTLS